jgi:hypothetical protein
MNIDELKNSFQQLTLQNDQEGDIDFTRKVATIVERVRKEDRRDRIMLIGASILLILLCINIAIIGVDKYLSNPHGDDWWGEALYVLSIFSILPVFYYKYRKIGRSNYDAPVSQFIADVEKKFAFFPKEYVLLILPFIILADTSIIFMTAESSHPTMHDALIAQIPIFSGLTIGLIIGGTMWYFQKLPILDELRTIKKSIKE